MLRDFKGYETVGVELEDGRVLFSFQNEGDGFNAHLEFLDSGRVRVWKQVWYNEYRPTDDTFPGFVSAARAIFNGVI